MAEITTPSWYAHPIGGGWDVRHAGCALFCCESAADGVAALDEQEQMLACEGCKGPLGEPPVPMDFDRDAPCGLHG